MVLRNKRSRAWESLVFTLAVISSLTRFESFEDSLQRIWMLQEFDEPTSAPAGSQSAEKSNSSTKRNRHASPAVLVYKCIDEWNCTKIESESNKSFLLTIIKKLEEEAVRLISAYRRYITVEESINIMSPGGEVNRDEQVITISTSSAICSSRWSCHFRVSCGTGTNWLVWSGFIIRTWIIRFKFFRFRFWYQDNSSNYLRLGLRAPDVMANFLVYWILIFQTSISTSEDSELLSSNATSIEDMENITTAAIYWLAWSCHLLILVDPKLGDARLQQRNILSRALGRDTASESAKHFHSALANLVCAFHGLTRDVLVLRLNKLVPICASPTTADKDQVAPWDQLRIFLSSTLDDIQNIGLPSVRCYLSSSTQRFGLCSLIVKKYETWIESVDRVAK